MMANIVTSSKPFKIGQVTDIFKDTMKDPNFANKNLQLFKIKGGTGYNIEEENNVFLVKTKIKDKKVEYECSCSVTGNCTSFHIEAVKYFTTGSMSGATLKPNMRKLEYLKKKSNKKEL